MADNEVVVQYGTERYCSYQVPDAAHSAAVSVSLWLAYAQCATWQGYASSFKFTGDFQDPIDRRADGTPLTAVLALDATGGAPCPCCCLKCCYCQITHATRLHSILCSAWRGRPSRRELASVLLTRASLDIKCQLQQVTHFQLALLIDEAPVQVTGAVECFAEMLK